MRSLFPELVDETFTNGSGPDLDVDEGLQVVGLHVGVVAAKCDQRWSKVQSLRLKLVSLLIQTFVRSFLKSWNLTARSMISFICVYPS